ncbi:hypothetical protein K2173_024372 [Erythroxylum novogranatense]|uniref:Reverse transcriptase Ty1/copia-type domain-containing protein n=1 Tax=Erythroxylum novogranatense TaxID=1862640 RepID=A0AAV8SU38_9ROSI|nr:hypothetical protein K2173_024372 [Erythroxylum novogranatense]
MVRSMMGFAKLPKSFWGYAIETAVYLLNRVPSKTVAVTPYEMWTNKRPYLTHLKVWGCLAYVKRTQSDKLDAKSDKCLFVGYPKETMGYQFYLAEEQKVFVSKHAVFLEKEFLLQEDSGSKIELEEVQDARTDADQLAQLKLVTHHDEVTAQPSTHTKFIGHVDTPAREIWIFVNEQNDVLLIEDNEPTTYEEVLKSSESEKWLHAMKSEMDSMYENQVWTLVEAPKGIKPIGCKWVFKKKTDMDGNVITYKARLVAKGFRQRQGVDYDKTFSPVAMLKSIRILLAITTHYDYEIWQMDVKTTFLNGNLAEDVYMTQPEGFTSYDGEKVCKLQKSIYGLKQAFRSWNIRFDEVIKEFGFSQNPDEHFKIWLSKQFAMKDLGEATYILGIRIYRDISKRLLGLSQSTYIDKMLKRFSMDQSKRGYLLVIHGITLSKSMCPKTQDERMRMNMIPYASAVAVKNILKYLRRTKDVFLIYGDGDLKVSRYTDASFQSDKDDSKSQSVRIHTEAVRRSVERVPNKRRSSIQQPKQSTLPLEERRKQFGSRSSLLNLVWFLEVIGPYSCIVTTMGLLRRRRNQGLINDPNTYSANII